MSEQAELPDLWGSAAAAVPTSASAVEEQGDSVEISLTQVSLFEILN